MSFSKRALKILGLLPIALLTFSSVELVGSALLPLSGNVAIAQSVAQGNDLLDAGQQQYQKGQLREALATYQQALVAFRRVGGNANDQLLADDGAGTGLQMVGLIYARLGQYQNALEALQSAILLQQGTLDKVAKTDGETALKVFFRTRGKLRSTLSFLGLVHARLAQYPRALELAQDALSRSGRGPVDYALDGEILNQLGDIYSQQDRFPQALNAYYRVMVMLEEVGYPLGRDISTGGRPINVIEANKRIYDSRPLQEQEITQFLERSLTPNYHAPVRMHPWARYLYVVTLNNIGDAYRRMGRSQAQQFYFRALESSRFANSAELEATSLTNVARAYAEAGSQQQAQTLYQQALEVSRKLGDRALEGKILTNLGSSFLQAQNSSQAVEALMASVAALESLRPGLSDSNFVSLFESQAQTYELLQKALIMQKKPEQALEIAERGRARAFVELLARRLQPVEKRDAVQPLDVAQIRQIAKAQKATLVEYSFIGNESLYIWVVKPEGEVVFRQVDLQPFLAAQRSDLTSYIEQVRLTGLRVSARQTNIPSDSNDRPTSAQLKQLYQLLIAPIADQLPQEAGARVVFVPQHALFLVPFAALQNAAGKYLIEQYTIAIAPSIQVLQLTQNRSSTVSDRNKTATVDRFKSSLIVGNPAMPIVRINAGQAPERLSELPGAEVEAKAIAALLNVRPLTRNQATEQTVVQQMPNHQVIHLATHGLLDDFRGLGVPGAIALAPNSPTPQPNDGLLTANEILDLKLNADLVVLSACDTGRGRITGDGVIGLSRSLLLAGTSNVVVSLWAVPDESTSVLMTQFYRELLTTPDKASALRQAMLKTLQKYPQPYDWAAFVFIGRS